MNVHSTPSLDLCAGPEISQHTNDHVNCYALHTVRDKKGVKRTSSVDCTKPSVTTQPGTDTTK